MLSESMYREFSVLSMKPEIDELLREYEDLIKNLAQQGEVEHSNALAAERDQALAMLDQEKVGFDGLMLMVARNLVTRFGGGRSVKSIRMWILRRMLPTTDQSKAGIELTDERFITQAEVAYFTAEQLAVLEQVAAEPEFETASAGGGDE